MTEHVATRIPEVPGIDLSYRPRTYFGPYLLARVTGHKRREMLRVCLANASDNLPPDLFASTLENNTREAIGRIHPALMGGEYLPPLRENEIEIARISLDSTTADQISVRAERRPAGIAYRIVDEYEDSGPEYACHPNNSQLPLTLAELIAMIDSGLPDGGAALSHLYWNAENGGGTVELRGTSFA